MKEREREREEEDSDEIIVTAHEKTRAKQLMARGVNGQDLIPHRKFNVCDFFVPMEPEIPNTKVKPISVRKQIRKLTHALEHPLGRPYVMGISSYPSDARAKYVAQMIMSAAFDEYSANRRRYGARSLPLWHTVYGNFKDKLRDGPEGAEKPVMLIISNIANESGSIKIEKVRDLLEMYADIPRIVVSAGQPTAELFAFRLGYSLNAGLYIGPQNLILEQV